MKDEAASEDLSSAEVSNQGPVKGEIEIFISRIKIIKLRCLAYFCGGQMMVFLYCKVIFSVD